MWTVCMTADWHGLTNCSACSWLLQKEHFHSMMFILLLNKKPFSYIWEVTLSNWETFSAWTITERSYSFEGAAWRLALAVYVRRAQSGRRRLGKLLSLQQGEVHVYSLDCPSGGRSRRLLLSQVFAALSQAPETSGVGFSFPTCWAFQKSLLWWLDTQDLLGGACGGPAAVGGGSCCHTSWKVPPRSHRQHGKALKRLETSTVCWAWRKTSTGFC